MDCTALFKEHTEILMQRTAEICALLRIDGLVLGAGSPGYFFEDDQNLPFRPAHHFAHWCPAGGPGHLLQIMPGRRPKLAFYAPEDFWFDAPDPGESWWLDSFDVVRCKDEKSLWQELVANKETPYLGPQPERARFSGFSDGRDVPTLVSRLHWFRSLKTPYEVAALRRANELAAPGHEAARDAFHRGESELGIFLAWQAATRQAPEAMPYHPIIGLNEKAAVLHYENKRDDVRQGKVMLIDSGYNWQGYGSDITRTHVSSAAPRVFSDLLAGMDKVQREFCDEIKPGRGFGDLHHISHTAIARLLLDAGILQDCQADEAVSKGLTRIFFPHGLGHMLGIFVHDLAGRQKDPEGLPPDADPRHPTLRTTRILEEGMVLTIEPGIYFIPMLLQPALKGEHGKLINQSLVEELTPCGGIRIEDNVHVTAAGHENLTRPSIPW